MFKILFKKNDKLVSSDGSVSILDLALRNNINLSYSCKNGRCGSCKCKVINGQTSNIVFETSLSDEDKVSGYILSCSRYPKSDLEIEEEEFLNFSLPDIVLIPSKIHKINQILDDIIIVTLRIPPTSKFEFIPGQYVDIIGPNGIKRSYSIANASIGNDKHIEFHIKKVDGGLFSKYWFNNAKENDLLRIEGPKGTFCLRNMSDKDIYFIATGTGFAPVKAMIESILSLRTDKLPKSVTLIWGVRNPDDFYYNFENLPDIFKLIKVVSKPDISWSGNTGYVQDVLLNLNPDFNKITVYACGSINMINSAKKKLCNAGLKIENFYSDAFVSSD